MLTVINVGGDLARAPRREALATLCAALGEAATRHPIVVVPGGGAFADAVQEAHARFHLRPAARHRMTLLAMNQFGCVLGDLIPDAVLCHTVARARAEAEAGHAAVLLPAEQLTWAGPAPESWPVSSDSIAVWVAGAAGGARALLLRTADDADVSGVPQALQAAGVDTWVVRGGDADGLVELLQVGDARVKQSAPSDD